MVKRPVIELRADSSVDKDADREKKQLRDKSYTHLKEAVDAIRDCGRFVFWKDEKRSKGYASDYLRQNRKRAEAKKAKDSSGQGSSGQ